MYSVEQPSASTRDSNNEERVKKQENKEIESNKTK